MKHSSNYYVSMYLFLPMALAWTIHSQILSYTNNTPQGLAMAALVATYIVWEVEYAVLSVLLLLSSVRYFAGPDWHFSWQPLERFSSLMDTPKNTWRAVLRIVIVVVLVVGEFLPALPWMNWSYFG